MKKVAQFLASVFKSDKTVEVVNKRAKTVKKIYLEILSLPVEAKKYMGEEAFNAYHEKMEKEYDESH